MTALPPHPNGAVHPPAPEGPVRSRRRTVFTAIAVLVALAWAYAIWYSVNRSNPEQLQDSEVADVRAVCAGTREALLALDRPPDVEAQAGRLAAENDVFAGMVADLRTIEPDGDDPRVAYEKWLDDWDALLVARADAADELARTGSARLELPPVREGGLKPITDRMDDYARQLGLDECRPDALEAERIDGGGDYTIPEV